MSTKAAKILHFIAFGLIVMSFAMVFITWLVLREDLLALGSSSPAVMQAKFVPWELIIQSLFTLILAAVWFVILLNRPDRSTTIAMAIVIPTLLAGYYALLKFVLSVTFTAVNSRMGANTLAALAAFNSLAGVLTGAFLVPGTVLMLLSLGGACGRDFKAENAAEPALPAAGAPGILPPQPYAEPQPVRDLWTQEFNASPEPAPEAPAQEAAAAPLPEHPEEAVPEAPAEPVQSAEDVPGPEAFSESGTIGADLGRE